MKKLTPDFWDQQHTLWRENFLERSDELTRQFYYLFDKLEMVGGKTVFEIGCGDSVFLEYLVNKYNILRYGIDYSDRGLDLIRRRLPKYASNSWGKPLV